MSEWNLNEKDLTNLEQEFRTDDHRYWESKKPDQKPNPMLSRKWGEINDGIETDLETFSQEAGERDGDFLEQIKTENRSRYDYREFLRKFAVFHEELAVDDDSFDYNFYTFFRCHINFIFTVKRYTAYFILKSIFFYIFY